jgi:serralysin
MQDGWAGLALPLDGATYGFNIHFNRTYYHSDPLARGTDGFLTSLHEIGHAIGLKHPFHGWPNLSASEDTTKNTVMSYTNGKNFSQLGPYDIAASQYTYGTHEAAAAAAIRWAHGPHGSLVTMGNDAENAIFGFDNSDIVTAGGGSDYIAVRGGDDVVTTGAGNDAVFGGTGTDTLITGVLRRQAVVAVGPDQGTVAQHDGMDTYYQVEILRFTDGDLHLTAQTAAGQAYRLYGAALGRAPDALGLSAWATALQSGATSLSGAASGFVGSAEFAARYGAPDNVGFVTLLYNNVLGRAPDAIGLNYWTTVMHDPAVNRSAVLLGFSESAEYQRKTAGAFASGMWVTDPEAADVLRAYVAVLDRRPDGEGLASWTAARENGLGQADLVVQFVSSAEFQDRFGGLSNRHFVEQLYRTALDRQGDPDGVAAWTHVLDAGIDSRSGVAFGFANSTELTIKVTPLVADGIFFV